MSPTVNNQMCPYCGRPPTVGGGATRAHIFTEAYGGRQSVVGCAHCNNGLGSGLEGKLIGLQSAITFFLQGTGMSRGELLASGEDGDFFVDLATGEHRAKLKVEQTESDGIKTVRIFGTPADVARVQEGLRNKYGEAIVEEPGAVPPTSSDETEPPWLKIDLSRDVAQLRRLVAMTALGGLTYLQGDPFIVSSQAAWLRAVLDAPRDWPREFALQAQPDPDDRNLMNPIFDPEAIFSGVNQIFTSAGRPAPDALSRNCRLVIVPQPRQGEGGRTLIAMALPGFVIPHVIEAPGVPNDMWSPVVLSEGETGPLVIHDVGLPNGIV